MKSLKLIGIGIQIELLCAVGLVLLYGFLRYISRRASRKIADEKENFCNGTESSIPLLLQYGFV